MASILYNLESKIVIDIILLLVLISGTNSLFNYGHGKNLLTTSGSFNDTYHHQIDNNYNFTKENVISNQNTVTDEGRGLGEPRFGHRKRMQLALLPIMYKMGVMTTLLMGLTVLTLKGLTIGVILLIFAFGNLFTKYHKQHSAQPIHVHVHSGDVHGKIPTYSSYPTAVASGPWERMDDTSNSNHYQEFSARTNNRRWYSSYPYHYPKHRLSGYRVT